MFRFIHPRLAIVLAVCCLTQPLAAQKGPVRLRYGLSVGETFLVSYSEFSTEVTTVPTERVPSALITSQEFDRPMDD
jgi:hypothetical protein